MKKLKVWGGRGYAVVRDQRRIIVAAYTQKQAIDLLNRVPYSQMTYHEFKNYWCETRNDAELAIANEVGVWVEKDEYDKKYTKVKIEGKP